MWHKAHCYEKPTLEKAEKSQAEQNLPDTLPRGCGPWKIQIQQIMPWEDL